MLFDHIGFNVENFEETKLFLLAALRPLNVTVQGEGEGWAMIGRANEGAFWFGSFGAPAISIHIASAADSRQQVREFHAAALAAGGQDNGAPGLRPNYHPNYYGAFVIGPGGHNLEAVCHAAEA